jgi:hypothetical protein
MNLTIRLLEVLGSPFVLEHKSVTDKNEARELYNYAVTNKIGFFFLDTLKGQAKLEEFALQTFYDAEYKKHGAQTMTAVRFSQLLRDAGVAHAVFKSTMPFPATPNDVDVIHFGTQEAYRRTLKIIRQSNYVQVEGMVDSSQHMFHDLRDISLNPHPPQKDEYDVDIYQKVAASHLIYLDKRKLEENITEEVVQQAKISVLRREAELAAVIIHSIIPEQLFTLLVYYATLYHFNAMSSAEIANFAKIAQKNHITRSARVHCSLVAELHRAAHGFVPEQIKEVIAILGEAQSEKNILVANNWQTPHRYSWRTVTQVLGEKTKDREFRRSIPAQIIRMLNPRVARWVISEVINRRKRKTY